VVKDSNDTESPTENPFEGVGIIEPTKIKILALGDEYHTKSTIVELSSESDMFFHFTNT